MKTGQVVALVIVVAIIGLTLGTTVGYFALPKITTTTATTETYHSTISLSTTLTLIQKVTTRILGLTNLTACPNPPYIHNLALSVAYYPKFIQAENNTPYTLAYGYNESNGVQTVNGVTTTLPNDTVVVFIGYGNQTVTCAFARNETVSMLTVTVPLLNISSSAEVYDIPQMSIDYACCVVPNGTSTTTT